MAANSPSRSDVPDADLAAVQQLSDAFRRITAELAKVIIGQKEVIEELLIALFAGGGIASWSACRVSPRR